MPRKGSTKARTGCITCKIRKVKCDEAKPYCERCTRTGRQCDGYVFNWPAHPGVVSADSGLVGVPGPSSQPNVSPAVSEPEFRALGFFHHIVAPALSGYLDSSFWTHVVQQVSQQEPSVRHGVAAISALYEDFTIHGTRTGSAPPEPAFAMHQYNNAIAGLVSGAAPDETIVLFVCLLLTCAEFLLGNIPAATEHCRHGVTILNRASIPASTRVQLFRVFCRLAKFPFFFGTSPAVFPLLQGLALPDWQGLTLEQLDFSRLQDAMDVIIYRACVFIHLSEDHRLAGPDAPAVPDEFLAEKRGIEDDVRYWNGAFERLRAARPATTAEQRMRYSALELKRLMVVVWVGSALSFDETVYDGYVEQFRAMVAAAGDAVPGLMARDKGQSRHKFTFEMGFLPLLSFVVMKCRCLRTRVAALRHMRTLAAVRESLFDVEVMYSAAKRTIELEHGEEYVKGLDLPFWPILGDEDEETNWDVNAEVGRNRETATEWARPGPQRVMRVDMDTTRELTVDEVGVRRRFMFFTFPSGHKVATAVPELLVLVQCHG